MLRSKTSSTSSRERAGLPPPPLTAPGRALSPELAPYYREFELPWEGDEEASARFRKILRLLLAPRADKVAERLVFNAYARAIQGFESYDTTVLMG